MNIRNLDEEAFIQDNWKAARRLTFDLGLRKYRNPLHDRKGQSDLRLRAQPVQHKRCGEVDSPAMNGPVRAGIDPTTGALTRQP